MKNGLTISLKKDLKGKQIITHGILRELIRYYSGQSIILHYHDNYINCRVNRQGNILVNSQLQELLKLLYNINTFILHPDSDATFHLIPVSDAADSKKESPGPVR